MIPLNLLPPREDAEDSDDSEAASKYTASVRWFFLPVLLCLAACLPPAHAPVQPEPRAGSGIVVSSASSAPSALRKLDGDVLTSTGATRFLDTGVLEIGEADAPLTLTVFTEYHCKYCYQFQAEFLPQLQTEFIATGKLKVRYVIKTLEKYPNSLAAKQSLLCAGKNGKGWQMHQSITNESSRTPLALRKHADGMGIDSEKIGACATDPMLQAMLDEQNAVMDELGTTLVPTLFLNDEKLVGLPVYADLRGWITEELSRRT